MRAVAFVLFAVATGLILPPHEEKDLKVDAPNQTLAARPGQDSAVFIFKVRNVGKAPITINQVRTSCGCTVASLPSRPWTIPPGGGGAIRLTLDLRGKSGTVYKTAVVDTLAGFKNLSVRVDIPMGDVEVRLRNQRLAAADRQLVFQAECASCHAAPTRGRYGAPLYAAACGICHDARIRATMVPDLRSIALPPDRAAWRALIAEGKPRTLMPGFAADQGGPLTDAQIDSLVDFLAHRFPHR